MSNIKCWQINLRHSKAATDHLVSEVAKLQTDIILMIQEPYLYKEKPTLKISNMVTHYCDKNNRALLVVPRTMTAWLINSLSNRDFCTCLIEDTKGKKILCTSGYMDIKYKEDEMLMLLEKICDYAKTNKHAQILCLDTNAHSTLWKSTQNNFRGNLLEDWILQNNLYVVNTGDIPTFVGHQGKTIIHITVVDNKSINMIKQWKVNQDDQLSDHRRLEFLIDFESKKKIVTRSYMKTNWNKFRKILRDSPRMVTPIIWTRKILEKEFEKFNSKIKNAMDIVCPLREISVNTKKSPWWSDDLANHKRKFRRLERAHRRKQSLQSLTDFKEARTTYKNAIKQAKMTLGDTFVTQSKI